MKKTPSPKVIASMWLLDHLNTDNFKSDDDNARSLSPESLTNLCGSRVNEAKVDKVIEQIDKIVLKLKERLEKVVAKFEAPPLTVPASVKPAAKKGKPEPAKKASRKPIRVADGDEVDDEEDEDEGTGRYDEDDEDEAPPPKKKKKKK